MRRRIATIAIVTVIVVTGLPVAGIELAPPVADSVVDLRTDEGVARVGGVWRYHDAAIVEIDHRAPGPDLKASGPPSRTHDLVPRAGAVDFDDSAWPTIAASSLEQRRSGGHLSAGWYVFRFTVPEKLGGVSAAGAAIYFETVVDDYAEIWVDGRLPLLLGGGGGTPRGWNALNRVLVTADARPGATHRIAVLAINGPLSDTPGNFVWIRSATLDVYRGGRADEVEAVELRVDRRDPALDRILPADARLERLASGFRFLEGPVWDPAGRLLFSDPNANVIYRWVPHEGVSIFRTKSGYAGRDIGLYGQPGSNGLTLDREGRLVVAEHGRRRIVRIEKNGVTTVLADRFEGKRFNSPNDLVYRSDGTLYFTDPPFGLPRFHDDPRRELGQTGVYRLRDGVLHLESAELSGPNGIAFSPDERFLYVSNWDVQRKVILRFPVAADGALGRPTVFFDMTGAAGGEALDGLKVDELGNVYASGPGGLWIISPEGRHLATLSGPELPANFAWGDRDGRTLYLTARTGLYRLRLAVAGAGRPLAEPAVAVPRVERLDPRLDAILPPDAAVETVAEGFLWVEGPVWDRHTRALLVSDVPRNAVYRWTREGGVAPFLEQSGYTGAEVFRGREPGSNGLAFDAAGRLVLCQHGDRRIVRIESDGSRTVLADRFRGRRLNSPNDLVFGPGGDLFFTDPPFGLPHGFDDPGRELDFAGVFRLSEDGTLTLLTPEVEAPNGLAFAPDGRTLYVSNADPGNPVWLRFEVRADGTLGPGSVFFDARPLAAGLPGAPDGLELDRAGNLFAAGPGGVWILAPDGTLLGRVITGAPTANVAWGEDGSTLFVAGARAIHRVRLATRGAGWDDQG